MKSNQAEFYRLEDRVLFEAGAVVQAAEAAAADANANAEADSSAAAETQMESASVSDIQNDIADLASVELPPEVIAETAAESGSAEKVLVVINSSVADANEIVNDLGTDCEVLILEAGTDALDTINDYLDTHSDTSYSALHIVSHGNDGYITLNGEKISNDTLNPADWKAIGEHLTDDADILLYGCNTASSDEGKALVQTIANLTGADVAASTDSTGTNGNWDLEYRSGLIESATLNPDHYQYSLDIAQYYTVNVNSDTSDGDNTNDQWTLREAIDHAKENYAGEEVYISFDTNVFAVGAEIQLSKDFELKVNFSITIDGDLGNGNKLTLVAADGKRIITATRGNISLLNLNLEGSAAAVTANGGVISYICNSSANAAPDGSVYQVSLDNVQIDGGTVKNASGGQIYFEGETGSKPTVQYAKLNVLNSTFQGGKAQSDNASVEYTKDKEKGSGGSITVFGSAFIDNCSFISNSADHSAGALLLMSRCQDTVSCSQVDVSNTLFDGNTARTDGGAVRISGMSGNGNNGDKLLARFLNDTFINNTAVNAGGAFIVSESNLGAMNYISIVNSVFLGNRTERADISSTNDIDSASKEEDGSGCGGGAIYSGRGHEGKWHSNGGGYITMYNNILLDNTANSVASDTYGSKINSYGNITSSTDTTNATVAALYGESVIKSTDIVSGLATYKINDTVHNTVQLKADLSDASKKIVNHLDADGNDTGFRIGTTSSGGFTFFAWKENTASAWKIGTDSAGYVTEIVTDITDDLRYGYYTAGAAQYNPVFAYTEKNNKVTTYTRADFDASKVQATLGSGGTFFFTNSVIDLSFSATLTGNLVLQGHQNLETVFAGEYKFSGKDVTLNGLTFTGNLENSNADVYVTNSLITDGGSISAQDLILANTTVYENGSGKLSATGTMNIVSSTLYNGGTVSAGTLNVLNSIAYNTVLTGANDKYSLIFSADDTTVAASDVFGDTIAFDGLALKTKQGAGGSAAYLLGVIAGYHGTELYYSKDDTAAAWYSFKNDTAVTDSSSIVKITADANGNTRLYSNGAAMGAYSSATESVKFDENGNIVVTTTADEINPYNGRTSLREAIKYFVDNNLDVATKKIIFSDDLFTAEKQIAITLKGDLEAGYATCGFVITGGVAIDGGLVTINGEKVPRVTLKIDGSGPLRHFYVKGGDLRLYNLTLAGNAELDDSGYVVVVTKNNKHVNATVLDALDGDSKQGGSMVYMKGGNFYADAVHFTQSYFYGNSQGSGVIFGGCSGTSTITVVDSHFYGLYGIDAATVYGTNWATSTAVFTNVKAHHNAGADLFAAGEAGGTFSIDGGEFSYNKAVIFGSTGYSGKMYTMSNALIHDNTVSSIVKTGGGGVFIMESCSVYNNNISEQIFSVNGSGSLTISNTTVYNNKVTAANRYMVNHTNGDLAILNSTFAGNYSEKNGFVGLKSSAANWTAVIANSIFALNKSTAADGTYTAIAQSGEGNVVKVYGSLITGSVTGTLDTAPGANLFDYENVTETAEDGTETTVYQQVRTFTAADIFGQELADAWQSVTYKYLVDGVEKEGTKYVLSPNAGGWAAHMKNVENLTAELSGDSKMFTVKAGTNTLISIANSSYAAKIADVVLVGKDAVGAARSDFFYTTIGAAAVQLKTSASMVNSTGDVKAAVIGGTNGVVTLRDAVAYAALYGWKFGESVTFDATEFASAQTITLGTDGSETFSGTIVLDSAYDGKSLTIDASTTGGLTLNLNGSRGFLISAENFTLSLTGMTITGGKVTKDTVLSGELTAAQKTQGGAILSIGANNVLKLNAMIFNNNTIVSSSGYSGRGGAIAVTGAGSSLTVTNNSSFTGNSITGTDQARGGAIYLSNTELVVQDSTFDGNYASSYGGQGGAIFVENGNDVPMSVTIERTVFKNNYTAGQNTSSNSHGGAVYISSNANKPGTAVDFVVIDDVTFENNTAGKNVTIGKTNHTGTGTAGAIYSNKAHVTITDTKFDTNIATGNAGAIWTGNWGASLNIDNCVFQSNEADTEKGFGGAVYTGGPNQYNTGAPSVLITNTTFYGNKAAYGGAIVHGIAYGYHSHYMNITVAGNTATKVGGGIYLHCDATQYIRMVNSIVLGNTSGDGADITFSQNRSYNNSTAVWSDVNNSSQGIMAYSSIVGVARHAGFTEGTAPFSVPFLYNQKSYQSAVVDKGGLKIGALYGIAEDPEKSGTYIEAIDTSVTTNPAVTVEAVFGKNGPVFNESKQIVEVYKSGLTLSGVQTALAGRAGLYSTDGGTTWYKISDGKKYTGSDTKTVLNGEAFVNGVKLTGKYAYGSAEELFLNYLVVDSAADNSDADAVVTLREAVAYALTQTGEQTITFAGVTDVITLSSALEVTGNLTIDCGTGVSISGVLTIGKGAVLTLNGDATLDGFVNNGTLNVTGNLSSNNMAFGNVTYSGTESAQDVLAGTYTTLTLSGSNTSKNLGGEVTASVLNADSLTIAGGTLIVLAVNTPAAPLTTVNNVTFVTASNALYLNSSNSVTTSAKNIYIVRDETAAITWNLNGKEYKDSVVYDGTTYTVSASVTAGNTTKVLSFNETAGATNAGTYTYTVKDGTDYTIAECNGAKYVTIGTNVYALTADSATSNTFQIKQREITIKAEGRTVTYDGTTYTLNSSSVNSDVQLVNGHTYTVTFGEGEKDAGEYQIGISNAVIKDAAGNDVTGNYNVTDYVAGTLKIEAQTLSGTISVGNTDLLTKTYDGTVNLNSGDLKLTVTDDQGNLLTLTYTGAVFNSANVKTDSVAGADKIIVSGIKLSNSNYTIGDSYEITNGVSITALALDTAAIQAADGDETDTTLVGTDGKISKVYDGTTNVGSLNLTIAGATGQTLTLNHTAAFAGKNVETTGQQIDLTGISIVSEGGILASNYILAETGTLAGEITKRDLTLTSGSQSWVYDRNEHSCKVVEGEGFVGDEKFTYTDFAVIKDVEDTKDNNNTFKYSDGTASLSNYNVPDVIYGTLAVTPKALYVKDILIVDETTDSTVVTGSKGSYTITKEYDGTKTVGDLLLLIDVGTGTYLTLDYTAAFDSANVKEVQHVLLTGLAVTGDSNYTLDSTSTEITGVITAIDLTVTAEDDTAVYNGNEQTLTGAVISGQLDGHVLADGYTFDASYTDAGTYKDIKVSESSVRIEDGNGGDMTGNYNLSFAGGTLTISKASLSVADAVANNGDAIGKVYDGTIAVDDLTLTIAGVNGTTLTLGYGSAAYNDADAADADRITVDGIALSADDAKNYELDADTREYSASISKRSITITAQDAAVVYNGKAQTLTESAVTGGSLAAGQVLTGITYGQGGTNAGSYTVSISDAVITDAQGQNVSANYELAYADGTLTIGKRTITITSGSYTGIYDGAEHKADTVTGDNFAEDEEFSYSGFQSIKDAGSIENAFSYADGTALLANYEVTAVNGSLTVDKRAVTVQADSMKVNVSEPPSELTYQIISGSLAAGDSFSGALKCEGSDAEQPGDYAITQGDLALTDNYILTFIEGTLTVEGGGQNADQSRTGSILNTSVLYTAVAGMTGSASAQTGLPPVFSSTEYQNGSSAGYIFAVQHNQLFLTAVRPVDEGRGILRLSSVLEQKLDRFAAAGETVVKDGETAVSDHLNGEYSGQTEEDERYDLNSEDYIFSEIQGLDLFTKADLFKDEIDLAIEEMMLA